MLTPAATFEEFYKVNRKEFDNIIRFNSRRLMAREDQEDFRGDVILYFIENRLIEQYDESKGASLNTYVTLYVRWLYNRRVARIVRRPRLHCMDMPHLFAESVAPTQYAFVMWSEMYGKLDDSERWALRHDAGLEPRYKTPSLVAYFRKRVRGKIDRWTR